MDPTSNFTLSQRTHARLHTRDLRTFSLSLWACSLEQQRPMHWRTASASNPLSLRLQCLLLRLAPRLLRTALAANRPLLLPALSALEPHRPSLILHTAASRQPSSDIDSFPSLTPVKLAFAIFFSPTPSSSPVVPFLHPI